MTRMRGYFILTGLFISPHSSVSGWKALRRTVKADSPSWYHRTATVTNAICEQACCSELPPIYPVETFNFAACVWVSAMCVWRVCDLEGLIWGGKRRKKEKRGHQTWWPESDRSEDGTPSAKFGGTVKDLGVSWFVWVPVIKEGNNCVWVSV